MKFKDTNELMDKKVGIQIQQSVYTNLGKEAKKQYRSISALVRKVLSEYLVEKGY